MSNPLAEQVQNALGESYRVDRELGARKKRVARLEATDAAVKQP